MTIYLVPLADSLMPVFRRLTMFFKSFFVDFPLYCFGISFRFAALVSSIQRTATVYARQCTSTEAIKKLSQNFYSVLMSRVSYSTWSTTTLAHTTRDSVQRAHVSGDRPAVASIAAYLPALPLTQLRLYLLHLSLPRCLLHRLHPQRPPAHVRTSEYSIFYRPGLRVATWNARTLASSPSSRTFFWSVNSTS